MFKARLLGVAVFCLGSQVCAQTPEAPEPSLEKRPPSTEASPAPSSGEAPAAASAAEAADGEGPPEKALSSPIALPVPECSYARTSVCGKDQDGKQISAKACEEQIAEWCRLDLIPRKPRLLIQVPGTFLIGWVAGGPASGELVVGPAVGISPAVQVPLKVPKLERTFSFVGGDVDHNIVGFRRNRAPGFALHFIGGMSTAVAGLSAIDLGSTDLGFTLGGLLGLQAGVEWYEGDGSSVSRKQFLVSVSFVAAYAKSDTIGDAALFGVQPSLILEL